MPSTESLSPAAIERALKQLDVPAHMARAAATGSLPAPAIGPQRVTQEAISARKPRIVNVLADSGSVLGSTSRDGNRLWMTLHLAPRTKKNGRKGGFGGIKQGPAYRRFRDAIVGALTPAVKESLGLPMPKVPYNIAVTYYVDRYGARADKCGLDQGLYDALENAGVVSSDWYFRTDDGTRIVIGAASPRVELIITPLEEGTHG